MYSIFRKPIPNIPWTRYNLPNNWNQANGSWISSRQVLPIKSLPTRKTKKSFLCLISPIISLCYWTNRTVKHPPWNTWCFIVPAENFWRRVNLMRWKCCSSPIWILTSLRKRFCMISCRKKTSNLYLWYSNLLRFWRKFFYFSCVFPLLKKAGWYPGFYLMESSLIEGFFHNFF